MKIEKETLHKIAHLARLEILPGEEEALLSTMEDVLTWMDKLNEVDTEGIEPLIHITGEVNNWREDVANNQLTREKGLANAPSQDGTYIKVPKVIE
jgi:aspartyl-tRNA(Asn)/glutamyl-tRNA(Gln) amidotransferase subunit C